MSLVTWPIRGIRFAALASLFFFFPYADEYLGIDREVADHILQLYRYHVEPLAFFIPTTIALPPPVKIPIHLPLRILNATPE